MCTRAGITRKPTLEVRSRCLVSGITANQSPTRATSVPRHSQFDLRHKNRSRSRLRPVRSLSALRSSSIDRAMAKLLSPSAQQLPGRVASIYTEVCARLCKINICFAFRGCKAYHEAAGVANQEHASSAILTGSRETSQHVLRWPFRLAFWKLLK